MFCLSDGHTSNQRTILAIFRRMYKILWGLKWHLLSVCWEGNVKKVSSISFEVQGLIHNETIRACVEACRNKHVLVRWRPKKVAKKVAPGLALDLSWSVSDKEKLAALLLLAQLAPRTKGSDASDISPSANGVTAELWCFHLFTYVTYVFFEVGCRPFPVAPALNGMVLDRNRLRQSKAQPRPRPTIDLADCKLQKMTSK